MHVNCIYILKILKIYKTELLKFDFQEARLMFKSYLYFIWYLVFIYFFFCIRITVFQRKYTKNTLTWYSLFQINTITIKFCVKQWWIIESNYVLAESVGHNMSRRTINSWISGCAWSHAETRRLCMSPKRVAKTTRRSAEPISLAIVGMLARNAYTWTTSHSLLTQI